MIIETKNLVKIYAQRKVVNNVSLQVEQGTIVGLLGPNGAGKTTTFYMVVGIAKPDSGTVTLDGKDISQLSMYQRARLGIGYLPQETSIFRKMTVEENLMSILETISLSHEDQLKKMEDLLEEFDIGHIRNSVGTALSGGERRRVEIARSLATDPAFILFLTWPMANSSRRSSIFSIRFSWGKEVVSRIDRRFSSTVIFRKIDAS